MKVLLDTCVHSDVHVALAKLGYDVIWSGNWAQDPGDEAILARAYEETRVLVTLDKDFGELAIVYGQPHSGIVRMFAMPAIQQVEVCVQVLRTYSEELATGAIITASTKRVRIRTASQTWG